MRSSATHSRDTWAAFVRRARERVGMPKVELARRLGVDRATISRWEEGRNRPEDPDVVSKFAAMFGLDLEEALAAAGLRPSDEPATVEPSRDPPMDPDVLLLLRKLANPSTPPAEKAIIRATLQHLVSLLPPEKPKQGRRKTG